MMKSLQLLPLLLVHALHNLTTMFYIVVPHAHGMANTLRIVLHQTRCCRNKPQVRQGHADYVRALAASPSSPDTWISGSYDHTVKMWDTRQPKGNVLELSHGAPVEACLFLPGGGLCVSAGGNEVKASVLLRGKASA